MDDDLRLTAVWLDRTPRPAAEQMALDEAMLTLATEGLHCLRLYRWQCDTVSLGANESALRTWDRTALARDGVPCVRRPTGGRAVWHATDDLTYAWTGPVASLGGVQPAYAVLHARLARALAPLALHATLARRPARLPGLAPGACFDVPVGGEVLVDDRKVIGSAQLVRHGALLQHGAIARTDRRPALDRYRQGAAPPAATPDAPLPPADAMAEAIAAFWHDAGAPVADGQLTSRADMTTLHLLPRYQDPAWTWRR